MSTILVPAGFSWITLSLVSVATLLQWQALAVGKARRKAGVTYPRPYADKAEQEASNDALIFNCLQRAHQNTLENIPVIVITTLIGALRYPVSAALACGLWSFARVVYTKGYASGDPKRRLPGGRISFPAQIVLYLLSGKVVVELIMAGV